jgi:flagellar FliL protein
MTNKWLKSIYLLLLSFSISMAHAADEEAESDYVGYVELKPFVANFGDTSELHFVKCEVTIQVGSVATEQAVRDHIAGVRNDILFLLMEQSEESMVSATAQKVLAKKAIMLVKQRLIEEEGEEAVDVDDLFFVSFVAQ